MEIIEDWLDRRYLISDIEDHLPHSGSGQQNSAEPVREPDQQSDFPPADIDLILPQCAWMRHCRDDASSLPENAPNSCPPDVQYLYAWKVARHCNGEAYCMEAKVNDDPAKPFTDIDGNPYECTLYDWRSSPPINLGPFDLNAAEISSCGAPTWSRPRNLRPTTTSCSTTVPSTSARTSRSNRHAGDDIRLDLWTATS